MGATACGDDDDDANRAEDRAGVDPEAERLTFREGTTRLDFDDGTLRRLERAGIAVGATEPALDVPEGVVFEIQHGSVRPERFLGAIDHGEGGIRFSRGSRSVTPSDFVVSTGDGYLVSDDPPRTVARLEMTDITVRRTDGGIVASGMDAFFEGNGADLLNDKLGTSIFSTDLRLGELTTRADVAPVQP